MKPKQVEVGHVEVFCQPWVCSSSGEHRPSGFSLHLSVDGIARYLSHKRLTMPSEAPSSYRWIDWRRPVYRTGIAEGVAQAIEDSCVEGLYFDARYDLPEMIDS